MEIYWGVHWSHRRDKQQEKTFKPSVWLTYLKFCVSGLGSKLNQLILGLFSLHALHPVAFLCLRPLSSWFLDSSKVAGLCENKGSLFCPLAFAVDLIVSVGSAASVTTIHTHPRSQSPLWMDIPFGRAPRWHSRFSLGCGLQKLWLTAYAKGWATSRRCMKVGEL